MDLNVEIRALQGGYTGRLQRSDQGFTQTLDQLRLGADDTVAIKGHELSLGSLVRALAGSKPDLLELAFDERGQLALGSWLYQAVFGDERFDADQVRLRIDTDESILPGCRGRCCAETGCSAAPTAGR